MNDKNTPVPPQQNNKKRMFLYLGLLLLAIVVIFIVTATNSDKKRISYTEFQTKMETHEVAEIDVVGNVIKIRVTDGVKEDSFPKKYDFYTTFINSEQLIAFVDAYNANAANADFQVNASYDLQGASFIEVIMPYLSLILMGVLAFFVFRAFSKNSGGGSMGLGYGKSKAKLVISSKVRFSDVAGADEEKAELQEVVEFLRNPQKFADLGAKIPKGILLVGPPGTGKTLLAKAVAGESKVSFFTISGSDFVEMFVGVGASRVRDLFDQAKKHAPCIIFIDEIDAVGRQRGTGLGGGNDEKEQTLNQLLVEMDGFEGNDGVIVLAATNRSDVLDPALLRPGRFDRQIYVHVPDVKGREEIIKIHAANKPIDDEVDFTRLARLTSGFTGADIANLLNEAAILAARDDRARVTMADITEGINKVLMGPQKRSRKVTDDDKRITAIHEGGHAIIARQSPKCDKVQEVSIVPRGFAGGYTLTVDDKDEQYLTKEKLLQSLAMMLGGRAAEELMQDDVTSGASNDMKRATELARKMVIEWGMSNKLGLISLSDEAEVFIGRDYQKQVTYSENMASAIDAEIKEIIDTAYNRAKKIILENKEVLSKLVELLLNRETIYSEEFEMLFEGKSVDEITASIDEKDKINKEKVIRQKKDANKQKAENSQNLQLKTAQALFSAGMISEKELNDVIQSVGKGKVKADETNAHKTQEPTEDVENKPKVEPENEPKKKRQKSDE